MKHRSHRSRKSLLAYLLAASIVALLLPRGFTDQLDHWVWGVLAPVNGACRSLSSGAVDYLRATEDATAPASEDAVQVWRRRFAAVSEENDLLRERNAELTGLRQFVGLEEAYLVQAGVIGRSTGPKGHTCIINQGSVKRVATGQLVLASYAEHPESDSSAARFYELCVVGKIAEVGPWTATVRLLTDEQFRLGVVIKPAPQRDRQWEARGVLQADAKGNLLVAKVSREQPVQAGDLIFTRGDAETLPVNVLLGTVQACAWDDQTPVMWRVEASPATDLEHLRRVVVVDMQGVQ